MTLFRPSLTLTMALLAAVARLDGAEFFVSSTGTAAGDGSPQRPFASIEAGLAKAGPGDTVFLRAGEYRLAQTLKFPTAGEPGKPITLAAYKGEYVALLGSVRLGGWQGHEGKIWKCRRPARQISGLFEDEERLTHPRGGPGVEERTNPAIGNLRMRGTWTQDAEWVYLRTRDDQSPEQHRIEAAQFDVVEIDKAWIRLEGLRIFFGQSHCLLIYGDHCQVVRCEIAHCSNSVDNAHALHLFGTSNSLVEACTVHDSYYWGAASENAHAISNIYSGHKGPNQVVGCEVFNAGLGVGSKNGAREQIVRDSLFHDLCTGIAISGDRGDKTDCGHYLVYRNRIRDCTTGVFFINGQSVGNRVWNNLITGCETGISMRDYLGAPVDTRIANNVFLDCSGGIGATAGRDGKPTLHTFLGAGLRSQHNLFFGNGADWVHPLDWSTSLRLGAAEIRQRRDLLMRDGGPAPAAIAPLELGSLAAQPRLDQDGRSEAGCPALAAGQAQELPPAYGITAPAVWPIGLGPWMTDEARPVRGPTISLAGTGNLVKPGEPFPIRVTLANASRDQAVAMAGQDLIVTCHFRYVNAFHADKQELWRVRVRLPDATLKPGASLALHTLPGWSDPVQGEAGSPFHLIAGKDPFNDPSQDWTWNDGNRLSATARFVPRGEAGNVALQRLEPLLRTRDSLRVRVAR